MQYKTTKSVGFAALFAQNVSALHKCITFISYLYCKLESKILTRRQYKD